MILHILKMGHLLPAFVSQVEKKMASVPPFPSWNKYTRMFIKMPKQ